jgi:hypothetical protein
MAVAYIAYQELPQAARAKYVDILREHPRFEKDLLGGKPDDMDEDLYAFMKAATWPDIIRSPQNPLHHLHKRDWHFINYPVNLDGRQGPEPEEQWDGQSDPANILQALDKNLKALKAPGTPKDERAFALCWVLHLVGDLHQPLHATALFSDQFPDGDAGGNLFVVRSATNPQIPLHTLWDHLLGVTTNGNAVKRIAERITGDRDHARQALQAELARTKFREWAKESFAVARDVAYDNGHLRGANQEDLRDDPSTPVPTLPVAYERNARDVSEVRIALGGYRLADTLR